MTLLSYPGELSRYDLAELCRWAGRETDGITGGRSSPMYSGWSG